MTNAPSAMRFLCFGVGAVGSYIGGSLALAGHELVFLERPGVADELRRNGLILEIDSAAHHLEQPQVVTSIGEALARGAYDAAILAVKSFDTAAMLETLAGRAAEMPPVLCMQNGVENEQALAAVLGAGKVIAGTLTSAIGKKGSGHIVLERQRGAGVAAGHALAAPLAAALNFAGISTRLYPNAGAMKWSKMLTNLLANATSAILAMTPMQIFSHPGLFRLELRQLREALQVMNALKLPVVDLPATPVRLLSWAVKYLPGWLSHPFMQRAIGKGRGEKMPSFFIDLYGGRGLSEVDYLNGAVARFGERLGVAAPVNAVLTRILTGLTNGSLAKEDFAGRPDKLLALLE